MTDPDAEPSLPPAPLLEYDSELAHDGTVQRVRTVPSELPPMAVTGQRWIGRWTLSRATVTLGVSPTEEESRNSTLISVLLPTIPPERLDAEGKPRDVAVAPGDEALTISADVAAMIDDLATTLDERCELTLDAVEEVLTSRPAGLGPPGWILVVCRDDGTAHFWLPPTPANSPLTNADLFCAEAHRQLGSP